jgi:hypothetical protein
MLLFIRFINNTAIFTGYEPFCVEIKSLFGADVNSHDVKALFRKIAANPEAEVDWSEVHN